MVINTIFPRESLWIIEIPFSMEETQVSWPFVRPQQPPRDLRHAARPWPGRVVAAFHRLVGGVVAHRIHGTGIFPYIWLIFMVNVGKYTIHGSYGDG